MVDNSLATPLSVGTVRTLVCVGAALSTLVASVMADEQNQRLKNGAFGTVAGGVAGALMALITKDDSLVVLGFFGSTLGACAGWIISLLLSIWAAKWRLGQTVLEYQIGGWQGVRNRLRLEDDAPLLNAYVRWSRNFARLVQAQKTDLSQVARGPGRDKPGQFMIRGWLRSIVDLVDLLFELGKRPNYRSRVTIIIYGRSAKDEVAGAHWISDAGALPAHKAPHLFDEKSIGYQVLCGRKASPFFTTGDQAKQLGQDRGEQIYHPFITFKITSEVVLSVDWPGDLAEEDRFVTATRELLEQDVVPAVADVLSTWATPLSDEVNLKPL